ncbi:MAG: bifunctional [glutamate--ammonia ligase]-adenylyl-L-tyrosine phosphorylase/[glutamate--ammonia-ligase] adenylyltransferase [Pseudomonadota bacterium]
MSTSSHPDTASPHATDFVVLLPAARERAARWRGRLAEAGATVAVEAAELDYVLACSDFVADALLRDESLRAAPATSPAEPFAAAAALTLEADFLAELRRVRRRELARIAWRDYTGRADTAATLTALTALADGAICTATEWARASLRARYGEPCDADGRPQPFVVVGMGKLGGGELNFSSDVDLVFLYPEGGETNGPRPVDNFEYYTRLGQTLIRLLDATTAEGFVYRVDMRLRPFGDSGPLVASYAALEDYLQAQGRDWERYAWVKARAITGADSYVQLFRDAIRPFVFRRYLDFGVFESLREMKALIAREVERRDLEDHVKLGPGGIREVEFVVQAYQLLRGGSDPRLQTPSLLAVLPQLAGEKRLSAEAVRELGEAYEHLRRLENRLQMYADEQTHALPADPERRDRLATALRAPDWPSVIAALDAHRAIVARHFHALVLAPEARPHAGDAELEAILEREPAAARLQPALAALGFGAEAAAQVAAAVAELHGGSYLRRLDEFGRKRLRMLLPRLLRACAAQAAEPARAAVAVLREAADGATGDAAGIAKRALGVVEAIGSRTSDLALLTESPLALARLVEICALGSFLPAQVSAFPLLLDELVDRRLFDEPPSRAQFERELEVRVLAGRSHGEHDDAERYVESLRQFQRAAVFRIALFDLTGRLPLMQVSDRLTDVAELIVERVMERARAEVTAQHGVPTCGAEGALRECGVAAVGYGKLGGYELGYASDLDLVFLHDSAGEIQQTAGPKVVDNAVFFLRLGQKIVHYLTVTTAAGRLYEVDMRLRPSGKGGLLMTNVDAFGEYQKREAWPWEHQALLHSRAIAGSPAIRTAFEALRVEILCRHVQRETLRGAVRTMRNRMRKELSKAGAGQFDLKQDPGGVADIEFLAQYWVLNWADAHPPLVTFPDTIRQLESVGSAALVDHRVVDDLVRIYREYRRLTHRRSLERGGAVVDAAPHEAARARVLEIWREAMESGVVEAEAEASIAPRPPAGPPL